MLRLSFDSGLVKVDWGLNLEFGRMRKQSQFVFGLSEWGLERE